MKITEIINSSGELIGSNDTPTSGSDLDTVAKGTTDTNLRTGHQPYRYDMMARFGFLGMPFFESAGDDKMKIFDEIDEAIFKNMVDTMAEYYKNPTLLKTDYREIYNKSLNDCPEKIKAKVRKLSDAVMEKVGENFKEATKTTIAESTIVEDMVVDKIAELEMSKKGDDNGIRNKDVTKIAGLINKKLDKKSITKLINLLETK